MRLRVYIMMRIQCLRILYKANTLQIVMETIERMVRDQRERFENIVMDINEVNEVNENIGSQSVMKYGAIIIPNDMNDNVISNDESERDDQKEH